MFSIGQLSKLTQVKVPTIRYYEEIGILEPIERTEGNQSQTSTDRVVLDGLGLDRVVAEQDAEGREHHDSHQTLAAFQQIINSCAESNLDSTL